MNKIKKIMTAFLPPEMWVPLALLLFTNCVVYFPSRFLTSYLHHFRLDNRIDDMIPFVPAFVSIYFGCYLIWIRNFRIAMRREEKDAYHFASAEFLIKMVALVWFIVLPTTNTRPEIVGNGIWEQLMRLLYTIDAPDNLFPSLHCVNSWLCFIVVRGHDDVPKWYKGFSLIAAFAVFASVLMTKQHVIVDIIGGVIFAEIGYMIAPKCGFTAKYTRIMKRISRKFGFISEE